MKSFKVLLLNFHKPIVESFQFWQSLLFDDPELAGLITAKDFFDDTSFFNIYPEESFEDWYE
jgi:hypothetical protein